MAEVGAAFVTIMPSARGFRSKLDSQLGGDLDASGKAGGSRWGGAMKAGALTAIGGAAIGAAAFAKSAISLEATFSKTMNVLQATTGATSKEMKSLSSLAMKMGADTAFSAADASQAMLELARGGIKPAAIEAGALQGSLTLAAAGELEMGEAANVMVKSMGQFSLAGKDAGAVAAALAGSANASSASVRDMSSALAQGGLAADAVGFSIQETTGILAAFSNSGMEGSDAGTGLKTMLDRLIPSTTKAEAQLRGLGIITEDGRNKFIKANGEFASAARISGLLAKGTADLSQSERKRALSIIFGSDAQRAATVLAKEGAAGIREMVKATSDQGAAQDMAAANMKGTAGALEQLKGSLETVTLQFGLMVAPAVQAGLKFLTGAVNGIVPGIKSLASGVGSGSSAFSGFAETLRSVGASIAATLGPAFREIASAIQTQLLPAFRNALPVIAPVAEFLLKVIGGAVVGAIKGAVQVIKGAIGIISGLLNLLKAVVTGDWRGMWNAVKQIAAGVWNAIAGAFKVWLNIGILGLFRQVGKLLVNAWKGAWAAIKGAATKAWGAIQGAVAKGLGAIGKFIANGVRGYIRLWIAGFRAIISGTVNAWRVLRSAFGGALAALRTLAASAMKGLQKLFANGWSAIRSAVSGAFKAIVGAVRGGVDNLVGLVKSIPGRIKAVLGNLGGVLLQAGRDLIGGLIRGITEKMAEAVNKVRDGLSTIGRMLPGSPIKEGPLKHWNNTGPTGPGGRLIGLLAGGISSNAGAVDSAMYGVTRRISVQAPTLALDATSSTGAAASVGRSDLYRDAYEGVRDGMSDVMQLAGARGRMA